MNGIIIYKSNYGSTKQYATWLSEETGFTAVDIKKAGEKTIRGKNIVILGSPIFAGKPVIAGWINKKWKYLADRKVILYTTSGAAPDDPSIRKVMENSFEPEIAGKIKYFPQGGSMVFAKLNPLHRFAMRLGSKMEKDPEISANMLKDKDHVDRSGIKTIIDYINN
ncbi:MAG: hypothetical protein JEZ04_16145 [Spirochaetales bacterium]|nr:hypothetical protein [Spirochaetales bacterium]